MRIHIFSIAIEFDKELVKQKIVDHIQQKEKGYICAVDTNIVSIANKNPAYLSVVNNSILNICDGGTIAFFGRKIYNQKLERYTGPDLFLDFISRGYSQAFLGNTPENLDILKDELEKCIMYGEKIACIIVNGGSTLYTTIDEIAKVVEMRKSLMDKYALDYCPHIHVDSVIGWAWLMFESYDFIQNPLEFSEDAIVELKYVYNHVKDISLADSFGVDFHKTGYSPYLCSMFICKDKQKVFNLGEPKQATMDDMVYGIYAPFTFTLESSRAGVSALEAWISLKQLGKGGYQRIIGTLVETGCSLRKHFDNADYSICRNNDAHGFVALVMLLPFELRTSLKTNIESFSDEELLKIAKYNHKFYLYALQLSVRNEIPFLLDYVSKQTTIREIKIGVMKFFPMSPFCNEDYLESFYSEFKAILDKFDEVWETMELTDSPFRPKPFVTR